MATNFNQSMSKSMLKSTLYLYLGALMELEDRAKIEEFLKNHDSDLPLPPVQDDETIFEYVVDDNGEWEHWNNRYENIFRKWQYQLLLIH